MVMLLESVVELPNSLPLFWVREKHLTPPAFSIKEMVIKLFGGSSAWGSYCT